MTRKGSARLTTLAALLVLSLIAFLVENAFPPIFPFAPFVKLGVSNVFVMLAAILFGGGSGYLLLLAKIMLSAVFGGMTQILYSLPAGLASLTLFLLLARVKCLSLCTLSALSSALFNVVQVAAAMLLTGARGLEYFLPLCVILGYATGFVTGTAAHYALRALGRKRLG